LFPDDQDELAGYGVAMAREKLLQRLIAECPLDANLIGCSPSEPIVGIDALDRIVTRRRLYLFK
jgi:hypothetical protein